MKNDRKPMKIKLEDRHEDNLLIAGIVSAEPDYKLSLFINRKTGISLRSSHPLVLPSDNDKLSFSVFSFTDEDSEKVYNLVANRSEHGLLLRNLRNVDFILTVRNEEDPESLITGLRETESVTGVFRLDASNDRNMQLILSL